MRAAALLVLLGAAVLAGCGASRVGTPTSTKPRVPPKVAVLAEGKRLAVVGPRSLRRLRLPRRLTVRRGPARLLVEIPRAGARRTIAHALARHERRVELPVRHLSSSIAIRPVRQILHNDCETTSLSMLLTAAGVHVSQLRLQAQLPTSGPLDPETVTGSALFRWGDPERGFVGRVDGSGPEGGFGVYEPPIRRLAARHGVQLVDLHGRSATAVRAAVLAGHPILAWVGLAAGPYVDWLTPSGREITVNFGEHAVVLVGATPAGFLVNNPLSGREFWSNSLFAYRFSLLGRRALELP